jgi:uncharacterized protein (TIGR02246 family)
MSTTDDIVAIQQLLARLNTAVDSGNGEAYAAAFTEDGEAVNGERTTKGRDALASLAAGVAASVPGLRHWVNNHAIDINGDRATATVYVTALIGGSKAKVVTTGRYAEELVRTPDGWRYSRREFRAD